MSKWTGRVFSQEEMSCLADVVVRSVRLDYEDKNRADRVVDYVRCGHAIYVAAERIFKNKKVSKKAPAPREVSAVIIPIRIDGRDVRWKEFHESMFPQERNCPERILNMLTPTSSEYALEWRKACRMNIARVWRERGIAEGMLVVTDRPLQFSGSHEAQIFRKEAERDVYAALTEEGVMLFKARIQRAGLGEDFSVWGSLEHYREHLQTQQGVIVEEEAYEPWLPQIDDVLDAAQMSLFS